MVNPWNACEPLDAERRGTYHNIMAISLPEGFHGLYVAEQEMIVLQRDLTLKCIGGAMFNSIKIVPERHPEEYPYVCNRGEAVSSKERFIENRPSDVAVEQ